MASKREMQSDSHGTKAFIYLGGLTEGMENDPFHVPYLPLPGMVSRNGDGFRHTLLADDLRAYRECSSKFQELNSLTFETDGIRKIRKGSLSTKKIRLDTLFQEADSVFLFGGFTEGNTGNDGLVPDGVCFIF